MKLQTKGTTFWATQKKDKRIASLLYEQNMKIYPTAEHKYATRVGNEEYYESTPGNNPDSLTAANTQSKGFKPR